MIFETDADRDNQETLQFTLELIGYRVEPTSTLCGYDFKLYRDDGLVAIVEYKARDKLWDPLVVDASKIRALVGAAHYLKCNPIFIVGCSGPPYHFVKAHTDWPLGKFTRKRGAKRRGEIEDEVFKIPAREFNIL